MDRTTRLSHLGPQRLRLLECLGGNDPRAAGYFAPAPDVDVFGAFRQYVESLSLRWAAERDPLTVSLLAAARLMTGDLAAAGVIVDHLPAEPAKLDHGAGICVVVPLYTLRTVLPLPHDLSDTRRWVAGSAEQAALRRWLSQRGSDLRWVEDAGEYRFAAVADE
jgi:hypothetical protein